jgi:hypothetical protein
LWGLFPKPCGSGRGFGLGGIQGGCQSVVAGLLDAACFGGGVQGGRKTHKNIPKRPSIKTKDRHLSQSIKTEIDVNTVRAQAQSHEERNVSKVDRGLLSKSFLFGITLVPMPLRSVLCIEVRCFV